MVTASKVAGTWTIHTRSRGTATPGCATHYNTLGAVTHCTGRSAGATPTTVAGTEFRRMDSELDKAATGPLWLRDPSIADVVEDAIFRGQQLQQYELDTYVVMANHVHLLIWPHLPLERITGGLKGVSARAANLILGRVGQHFWEDESFDHWVRNNVELRRIRIYIEQNPVTAGLVKSPEDWPWSSAAKPTS